MLEVMNNSEDELLTSTFSWGPSYRDAMLELDPLELRVKINIALSELKKRTAELMLAGKPASSSEWQALVDAHNNLRVIEKHELISPIEAGASSVIQSAAGDEGRPPQGAS
ncbi:MAG: hypothetical protein ABSD39_02650 [Terriglobales bacterium]|jgi:hypothetical protein